MRRIKFMIDYTRADRLYISSNKSSGIFEFVQIKNL